MATPKDTKKQQITLVLEKKYVRWLDNQAKDLDVDRTKLCRMIFHGMMTIDTAAEEPDSLFAVYQNHLEGLLEAATIRKAKSKK